jgi:hypothetical protein
MYYIGLDVHKRTISYCVKDAAGHVHQEEKIGSTRRERWVMRRPAVINQIRGLLLERGITVRKGRCHVEAALPGILEDPDAKLSGALRVLLAQLQMERNQLPGQIDEARRGDQADGRRK